MANWIHLCFILRDPVQRTVFHMRRRPELARFGLKLVYKQRISMFNLQSSTGSGMDIYLLYWCVFLCRFVFMWFFHISAKCWDKKLPADHKFRAFIQLVFGKWGLRFAFDQMKYLLTKDLDVIFYSVKKKKTKSFIIESEETSQTHQNHSRSLLHLHSLNQEITDIQSWGEKIISHFLFLFFLVFDPFHFIFFCVCRPRGRWRRLQHLWFVRWSAEVERKNKLTLCFSLEL